MKTITLKMENANQDKEKSPDGMHKDQRPIRHTFRSPLKVLVYWKLWKLWYIDSGAGADLLRPCACCFSLCEFIWTLLSWFRGPCSPGVLHPCGSYTLSASSAGYPASVGTLISEGKDLIEASHLKTCLNCKL